MNRHLRFARWLTVMSIALSLVLPALTAHAQTRNISGVVKSDDGSPLPGASIVEKGTANGTVTDGDGNFKMSVSADATIVVSFIGMIPKELSVGNQTAFDIKMDADLTTLDEITIVDVGYGTMKKADLTGSISSISGDDIRKVPVSNIGEAIAGRMPGVKVMTTDGSPDAEIVIRVRGGGSVTQDNSPLYVVDGFIVSTISDIPPTDIVSIDVLKDASATAIYGARGANGVVLINTRKPKAGSTTVSYNGYIQARTLPRKLDVLSPYEYVLSQYEFAKIRSDAELRTFEQMFGKYDDLELYKYRKGTDWQEESFGEAQLSQYHNISISGGTDKTKVGLSLTNNTDEGLLVGSGFKRNTANFKLNHELFKTLKFDVGARITKTTVDGAGTSGGSQLRIGNVITARPVNGIADELDLDFENNANGSYEEFVETLLNPVELTAQDWRKKTTTSYVINTGLAWDIMKNLQFNTAYSFQFDDEVNKRYYGYLTSESQQNGGSLPLGVMTTTTKNSMRWSNTLTYNTKIGGIHDISAMVGQEVRGNEGFEQSVRAEGFIRSIEPENMFANMQSGTIDTYRSGEIFPTHWSSYFGRVFYQLNNKYLASFTFRNDASSVFVNNNVRAFFPAASVGWKLSEEPFLKPVTWVDELKLRVSYGEAGNDRIDPSASRQLYSVANDKAIGFDNEQLSYLRAAGSTLANPNVRWETTITRNAGVDFSLIKGMVMGSFDAYWNTATDLLLESDIPESTGFTKQFQNIGSTSNKGIELALTGYLIDKGDFSLSANFNIGMNRSKIEKLDGKDIRQYQSGWASTDLKSADDYRIIVGETVGLMYGYVTDGMYTVDDFTGYEGGKYTLAPGVANSDKVVTGLTLRPGMLKLKDLTGEGTVDENDRQVIGNALPKHTGGFGINARYKSVDLSMFFNWSYGNDVYNTGKMSFNMLYRASYGNMLDRMNSNNRFMYINEAGEQVTDLESLRELNQNATVWSPFSFGTAAPVFHSDIVEDGSFLRLNNVTLGYSLPASLISKARMKQFRVYGTVNNAWIWTNYTGYDPDVSTTRSSSYPALTPGVDFSAYPKSRTYTFGVNVTF